MLNVVDENKDEESKEDEGSEMQQRASSNRRNRAYNSKGTDQSRFESSPIRSPSIGNSRALNRSKDLVDMAMTIMGECEMDMPDDAKKKLSSLASGQSTSRN